MCGPITIPIIKTAFKFITPQFSPIHLYSLCFVLSPQFSFPAIHILSITIDQFAFSKSFIQVELSNTYFFQWERDWLLPFNIIILRFTCHLYQQFALFLLLSDTRRCLLLGRTVMANLDSILKGRDNILSTKVHLLKAMVFPVVMYGCES